MSERTILVVDDDPDLLEISRRALQRAGFRISSAQDFSELEAALDGGMPDLVLIDVHMPELFGDDVAMILRQKRNVTAPIFLYSSLDDVELARLAREAGVDGYISKSGGVKHLVARVEEILSNPGA